MAGKIYITEEGKKNSSSSAKKSDAARTYRRADGTTVTRPAAGRANAGRDRDEDDEKETSSRSSRDRQHDEEIEAYARIMLQKKEQRRRIILIACATLAVCGIGFFIINSVLDHKKSISYQALSGIREQAKNAANQTAKTEPEEEEVVVHLDGEQEIPDVLPEFQEMLKTNSKIVGWITIDDTKIDYPVAQTTDNEYYLNHDLNQNEDRNGTIFLDTNCDIIKPSTNLILYGHHMQSGNMFGNLGKYEDEKYYEKHKYITFDTLYEHGTYEVMYVFRSHVYGENEVVFKYYQFIDAYSEVEFDSYMQEMADISFYDTGVTATFGDRLLTLSTCDYQEKDGRFVVVAKKIK